MKKLILSVLVSLPFGVLQAECQNLDFIKEHLPEIKTAFQTDQDTLNIENKAYKLDYGPEGHVVKDFLNGNFEGYRIYRVEKKDGAQFCKYVVYDPETHVRGSFFLNAVK